MIDDEEGELKCERRWIQILEGRRQAFGPLASSLASLHGDGKMNRREPIE